MYHPLHLPHEMAREPFAAVDLPRPREAGAAEPCYRSEAFPEDLDAAEAAATRVTPRRGAGWLFAAPLGTAVVGAWLSLIGQQV